jgi:polysaccharide deacetylase 2 family uncharacterized protein YibQ
MKLTRRVKLTVLILLLVAFLSAAYVAGYLMFGRGGETLSTARRIDPVVSAILAANNLPPADVQKNLVIKDYGRSAWEQIEVVIDVGEDISIADLSSALTSGLDQEDLALVENTREPDPSLTEHQITIYSGDMPIYQILFTQKHPPQVPAADTEHGAPEGETPQGAEIPRIAIIVDDAGYDLERALELLNLRRAMTISSLPKLKYSRQIAEVAHDLGYEVMMHLPMESGKNLRRNPGFITPDMTEKEMYWIIDKDLESIPYVSGVNNHQGSMMTRDREAMIRVMKYLGDKDLFFIDSRTTSETIAYQTAKDLGLRAAENSLFLDNEKNVEYIKERIQLLMQEAKQNGKGIGLCHVHPETTKALHEMLPVIEAEGIKLVHASELAE